VKGQFVRATSSAEATETGAAVAAAEPAMAVASIAADGAQLMVAAADGAEAAAGVAAMADVEEVRAVNYTPPFPVLR